MGIKIPNEMPVMKLTGTVLFQKTIIPLYIFEERYRKMLADALAGDRIFVIANAKAGEDTSMNDAPLQSDIATVGLIRMSSCNPDGTSTVVLQGTERIRITESIDKGPYPKIRVVSEENTGEGSTSKSNKINSRKLLALLEKLIELEGQNADEFLNVCKNIKDLEALSYFTMQAYCDDSSIRQNLLETLDSNIRIQKVLQFFEDEIAKFELKRDISDKLSDGFPPLS